MKNKSNWNKRFVKLVKHISKWSKDPNRKTAAIIVDDENTVRSIGYNGLPNNIKTKLSSRYDKPKKYFWVEHAERNAIYKATKNGISVDKCTMYVNYYPCVDCARAIIQSGIKKLYTPKPDFKHEKWGESWKVSKTMLKESKIKVKFIKKKYVH